MQILEPCFNSKMLDAGKSLCSLLKMVFTAFPLESTTTPPDVKLLYQKVVELIQKHLAAVTAPQLSLEVSSANSMISFTIYILKALTEVQKNFVDPFVGPLVRVLQRLARDMGSSAGSQIRQVRHLWSLALYHIIFIWKLHFWTCGTFLVEIPSSQYIIFWVISEDWILVLLHTSFFYLYLYCSVALFNISLIFFFVPF